MSRAFGPYPSWPEARIAKLSKLWGTISAAAIGREIGVSKNAVVGKAHRLGLPAQPSPIERTYSNGTKVERGTNPRRRLPTPLASLVPLASLSSPAPTTPQPPKTERLKRQAPAMAPPPPPRPSAFPGPAAGTYGMVIPCCWPDGDTRPFRFCEQPSLPGRPYCLTHAKLAYRKIGDPE